MDIRLKCDRRDCKYFDVYARERDRQEKIVNIIYAYPVVCVQCTWLNRNFDNYEEK